MKKKLLTIVKPILLFIMLINKKKFTRSHFKRHFYLISVICFSGLCFANDTKSPTSVLYVVSKGLDHIGKGKTYNLTDSDGIFRFSPLRWSEKGITVDFYGNDSKGWTLNFVAQKNQPLQVGETYRDTIYTFLAVEEGKPGMDITTDYRGCNRYSGKYTVLELNKSPNGDIQSIAMDFEQNCDSSGLLVGSLRYHSTIPVTILPKSNLVVDMKSDQGDWIGQGKEFHFNSDNIYLTNDIFWGYLNTIEFNLGGLNYAFGTKKNEQWHVGKYLNAERHLFGSPDNPSLDISGDGRGCNSLSGSFEVLDVDYDKENGSINKLELNFEQHCEGAPPALRGSIHYNSKGTQKNN